MTRLRAVTLAAISATAVAGAYACSIYDSSLLLPANNNTNRDAGEAAVLSEAGGVIDGGNVDTCKHVVAPGKPTTEDGTLDIDVTLAASYLRFLPVGTGTDPSPPRGLDLDGVCTCPGPESCAPLTAQTHCDGEGGTDDSAGDIFTTFATIAPDKFSNDALNRGIASGIQSILVRVKSYNGGQNDKQVTVIVYAANGINGIQDGGDTTPKLDGTDVWTLDPGSLLGGANVDGGATCEGNDNVCVPFFADTEAYVSNGVVVAHLDFPITVGSLDAQLTVKLSGTTLSGTLIKGDGGIYQVAEGQVAGRWNTAAFLTALAAVRDPLNHAEFLCGDAGTYLSVKQLACKGSDLMSAPADDNMGKPCDALSVAVSFSAVAAHLGPIFNAPLQTAACGANWKDDCTGVK